MENTCQDPIIAILMVIAIILIPLIFVHMVMPIYFSIALYFYRIKIRKKYQPEIDRLNKEIEKIRIINEYLDSKTKEHEK